MQFPGLPGGDLIEVGLADLAEGVESVPALLVSVGAARLRRLGLVVPPPLAHPEHRLYACLAGETPDGAHSRYNALIRRLVSFERGAECALADAARIRRFMEALAGAADADARVYFAGGATAVLLGWRPTTIDVDLKLEPDRDALRRAIPRIQEELHLNVELASPADFMPVPPGWEDRSPFIAQIGRLAFFHFDLYAQALAKIERGHSQDMHDVRELRARGLVDPAKALAYFARLEPELYRFPAIDPPAFRRAVEEAFRG
jgi:hypothetical protein